VLAFLLGCQTSAEDADQISWLLDEAHHEDVVRERMPDDDLSRLVWGVILVMEDSGQGVGENRTCCVKAHTVFAEVGGRLSRGLFEA
jgi:hypothetical protein